jgi:deoxycytidine triphosphate deaminase
MPLKSGKDLAARLQGIIQEKYQVHRFTVDLTVKSISEADPIGRVDFGGGEYAAAGRIPIRPLQERPEDSYMWWTLSRGCYFIEFNETLKINESEIAILEPDERLMRAGGTHAPAFLRGNVAPIETLLIVEVLQLHIKQNARISHLRLFDMM